MYAELKTRALKLEDELSGLVDRAGAVPGVADDFFKGWKKTCQRIRRQLDDEIVRVAVVGPIKSGKSTVVNAFFKGDYLKRGAGVITSMVTKVRSGERLRATLVLKSWEEVNSDIERAVVMLPSIKLPPEGGRLDIRDHDVRQKLNAAIENLPREYLITKDSRNMSSVLLSNYLAGYDDVADLIGENARTLVFEQDRFAMHRDFAGSDRLSVYLKDIRLDIDSVDMDRSIEIADCQGSDSPNPLHLARIQDYLLLTNLTVYVISSRIGIRQADINFLSMIDSMGISDNLVFVVNCDLDEHEDLHGLTALAGRIKEEISLIRPDPEVYVFSALLNLFRALGSGKIGEKDARRLERWELEKEMTAFCDKGWHEFETSLYHNLNSRRCSLLIRNNADRLLLVASGLEQWALANVGMLKEDEQSAAAIFESTKKQKEKLERAGELLKSTLDGFSRKLKKELRAEIDRFFDPRAGDVAPEVTSFIRNYKVELGKYEAGLSMAGFSNTLYMVFQEFRQALDVFMAKSVNPRIMGFIKKLEGRIGEYFGSIAESYDGMVRDAIAEYGNAMKDLGVPVRAYSQGPLKVRDISVVKSNSGIDLPSSVLVMNYTGKIRTEAVMRLGVYSVGKLFKKLLKKPPKREKEWEIKALKDGISRIKSETEKTMLFHFKNYRENIKFQYVFRLVDAVSESFYNTVLDRFRAYSADISSIREAVSERRIDKEQAASLLNDIASEALRCREEIARLKQDVVLAVD